MNIREISRAWWVSGYVFFVHEKESRIKIQTDENAVQATSITKLTRFYIHIGWLGIMMFTFTKLQRRLLLPMTV
jgi:hypothetical protein